MQNYADAKTAIIEEIITRATQPPNSIVNAASACESRVVKGI